MSGPLAVESNANMLSLRCRDSMAVAIFLVLALASSWPLARHLNSSLALGTENAAAVPLLNTWTIWWNTVQPGRFYRGYWNAPIFHPVEGAFAFSEPLALTVVGAPFLRCGSGPIVIMNALLLAALMLNGWTTYRLALRPGYPFLVAVSAGAMMVLLPFVHCELGVFQLVWVCGAIWVVDSLYQLGASPKLAGAVKLGASFAFTYLMCAYYGLFLLPVLCLSGGWLLLGWQHWRRSLGMLAVAGVVAAVPLAPVVWGQVEAIASHQLRRSGELRERLSAVPASYANTKWQPLLPVRLPIEQRNVPFAMSPGLIKFALAAVGIISGFWLRRARRWTAFWVTFLAAAFFLSLGPKLKIAGWSPYETLAVLPGFAQARSPFRFGMFVQLATVFLAAGALDAVRRWGDKWIPQHGWRRLITPAVVIILGTLGTIELWPPMQRLYRVPAFAEADWVQWLRDETPPDSILVHLPMCPGKKVQEYEPIALAMYAQTIHHRRMVNGYSGFFPAAYQKLRARVRGFPDARSVRALADDGVDYCVVSQHTAWRTAIAQVPTPPFELLLVFEDVAADVGIYRLERDREDSNLEASAGKTSNPLTSKLSKPWRHIGSSVATEFNNRRCRRDVSRLRETPCSSDPHDIRYVLFGIRPATHLVLGNLPEGGSTGVGRMNIDPLAERG
jgi:hypothetical protein